MYGHYISLWYIMRIYVYYIVSASRSPPGPSMKWALLHDFGVTFTTLAPLWESILLPWGHFWSTLDALFVTKNRLGRQRCPQRRHHQNKVTYLDTFWRSFSTNCRGFDAKGCVLETGRSFSSILGRFERSRGWAHMRSVHACAVQTHFSVFVFFLKKGSLKTQT